MSINESGENYLETILMLKEKNEIVRSIDIAKKMSFSKPSVSRAVNKLKHGGFIMINANGNIDLTVKGYNRAKSIYERHQFFCDFLLYLGIDEEIAKHDACRIEHVLSEESFEAIKAFVIKKRNQKCE